MVDKRVLTIRQDSFFFTFNGNPNCMKAVLVSILLGLCSAGISQINILSTNPTAENILLGDYDPTAYASTTVIDDHDDIIQGILSEVNADSLKSYILKIASFQTRNTGSDTISLVTGIGASRKWVYSKFQEFSGVNDDRLIPSYLQFDQTICSITQHRNIFAVLPGTDTANHRILIVEGHLDSRCDGACDISCLAEGVEDNASGSALVLELARVMSKYTFKNSIVFMLTIGEEQGLYGANAFSQYCKDNDIPVEAVFNNDVVGGIYCGETSSPPSCPGLDDVDSTQVRLFSFGGFDSKHKQLARFIKLQYQEELLSYVSVPMMVTIMSGEDRVGRGGDHIPFRQDSFTAMRFTSANEHGDASLGAGYTDRQHTSEDILGVDTDADLIIDSFFVDFNYLARNAVINGNAVAMAAIGPLQADFEIETFAGPGIIIKINVETGHTYYRVGLRTTTNDWDSVYVINGDVDTIYPPSTADYIVSVAAVDDFDIESLFSREIYFSDTMLSTGPHEVSTNTSYELLQNRPNPFDEATIISVKLNSKTDYESAHIEIRDLQGKRVESLPIALDGFMNEVTYQHGYGKTGIFTYTLVIDGVDISTRTMVFAN